MVHIHRVFYGCGVAAALLPLVPFFWGRVYLQGSMVVANLLLAGWFFYLLDQKKALGRVWTFQGVFRGRHLVQACAQFSIYLFLSQFSKFVPNLALGIFYQIVFAILFDALLSLHRTGKASLSFAALPIVFSVNFFMVFKEQYFFLQVLLIALAVASKYFLVWSPNGVRTHIFNPSGIVLATAALITVWLGPTHYILLDEMIQNFTASRPYIFAVIFVCGCFSLVVGRVVPIAFGAFVAIFALNGMAVYLTGKPMMNHWIDPSTFLGVTLLITDPKTSPRRALPQFIFGLLYGVGVLLAYGALSYIQAPGFFLKVLPVPILNLLAPTIDKIRVPLLNRDLGFRAQMAFVAIYAIVFLTFVPLAVKGLRQQSVLGLLGGYEWSLAHRR